MNLLLQALEDAAKDVDYYALDLSLEELQRTLAQLPAYKYVRAHGLWGTYDDGQAWLKGPGIASRKKCILSLGSSVGELSYAVVSPSSRVWQPNAYVFLSGRQLWPSRCCRFPERVF